MIHVPNILDFESWRTAARKLLAAEISPAHIDWPDPGAMLLPMATQSLDDISPTKSPHRVPRDFLSACKYVACHRDADRWALMYRALWRLTHGEPALLDIAVDEDVYRLTMMEKAVRRDRHKMTAFVRFRVVRDDDGERYVAWHRPDHHIVRLAAPFFAERFAVMRWAILTPEQSVSWDGNGLQFFPGVPRTAAPREDELEDLWKTYYGSIFNPARIKLKAMRAEMPVRHWATLPETQIISQLLDDAPRRIGEMAKYSQAAQAATTSTDTLIAESRSLPQLRQAAAECRGCDLHCRATQVVFGEGPADARLMLVGEQPGDEEDLSGHPFVGPAGRLLNNLLHEAGIDRQTVYVTNTVKHFSWEPRGKRRLHKTPSSRQTVACFPWLQAEMNLVRPDVIVCLGATAARAILGRDFSLTRQRGTPQVTPHSPIVLATWHPSALLRIPDLSRRTEAQSQLIADLRQAAAELAQAG